MTFLSRSTRPAFAGSGSLAGGVGHVSESWLFYYGTAGSVLSVVSTLSSCRGGGAAAAVGVERGERGERRGLVRVRVRVRVS